MSTIDTQQQGRQTAGGAAVVDMKLEVIVVPVSDVDRAKQFYTGLGWRLDADIARGDEFRIVQLTPPGSGCSIQFGIGVTAAEPGSLQSTYLVVSDIEAARTALVAHGADVSQVFHEAQGGSRFEPVADGRAEGAAADHGTYASFATFNDPDGNGWLLQEITARLPGRVDADDHLLPRCASSRRALTAGRHRPRRARAAHRPGRRRTGRPGTPSTWSRSRRAQELPT